MEELFNAIPEIVEFLPSKFTSHQLILKLAQANQRAYIEALHKRVHLKGPFRSVHSAIGKHLQYKISSIRFIEKTKDTNIFGKDSDNALWEKV